MGRPIRVLVVDDDEVIRQLITVNLELEEFEVITAADGEECLRVAAEVHPDVITLDVMMPRLDGWDTAVRLRSDPALAQIKIVMLSARAQAADVRRGDEAGADAYLTKPFDPEDLVRTIREVLQR